MSVANISCLSSHPGKTSGAQVCRSLFGCEVNEVRARASGARLSLRAVIDGCGLSCVVVETVFVNGVQSDGALSRFFLHDMKVDDIGRSENDPEASAPIRVLLAEDHVLVRAGICALLQGLEGVEVVAQASNGHEALRLLEKRGSAQATSSSSPATGVMEVDVALLDISMRGMNGLEAAAQITRLHARTRVVMLSMHDSEEYVLQALRAGAAGYLLKDSGFNELEIAVRAVARGEIYLSPAVSCHLVSAYVSRLNPDLPLASPAQALPLAQKGAAPPEETRSNSEAVVLTPRQQEILRLLAQGLSNGQIAKRLLISIKTVETHRAQLMGRLNIFDIVGLVRYAVRHGFIEPL